MKFHHQSTLLSLSRQQRLKAIMALPRLHLLAVYAIMADLPIAVLTRIFQFQSLFELKYGSMLVSTQWKDAASDPVLWKDAVAFISPSATSCLDLNSWINGLTRKGITRYSFHRYCPRELIVKCCRTAGSKIKSLAICGCSSLTAADINEIITSSINIEFLDVSSCSSFADFTDFLLLSNQTFCNYLPKLQSIDLGHTNFKQVVCYPLQFLQGIDSKSLQHLGLSGIGFKDHGTEIKLVNIIGQLHSLNKLNLSFTDLSESFFKCIDSDVVPNLEEVNLTGCTNLTKATLEAIMHRNPNLRNIIIKQARDLTYIDILCIISKSTINLNVLEFSNSGAMPQLEKSPLSSRVNMRLLCGTAFSSLRELCLSNCQISHDFVLQFCKYNPKRTIQVLQIASCGLSDQSLIEICRSLKNLKKLDISRNYRITDSGLLGLAQLEKPFCNRGESDHVEEFSGLSNLKLLEELSMMYLTRISDEGLKSVLSLKLLRKFSIQGCRQLSNKVVKDLFGQGSLLCELDVGKVSVDDGTVEHITRNMWCLHTLNLSRSDITDKTLEILSANCQCLRSLDISGCENVTEIMIRKFVKGFGRRLFEFNSSANVVFELARQ